MILQDHKLSLVIPTLNEAGNIALALDRAVTALKEVALPWEILVVDDSSSDGTQRIVERYHDLEPRVRLINRSGQRGLAGAITYGWAQTDADIIGVMDADLQHPPELLPQLIAAISDGADLAIASRYVSKGTVENWNWARKAISRVAVVASRPVQRQALRVQDPMSGFFILQRDCIAGLEFQPEGFKLLLEILAKGRIESVVEVPFAFASRQSGTSKANAVTGVHYLSLLYRLSCERLFRFRSRDDDDVQFSMPTLAPGQLAASRVYSEEQGSGILAQSGPNKHSQLESTRARSLELILGLLPLLLGLQLILWLVYGPIALHGSADFRVYYSSGYLLRSGMGDRLYDDVAQKAIQSELISPFPTVLPYTHPPYEALFFSPFTYFSYRTAYLSFLGLNLLCLFGCYRLLHRKLWRVEAIWRWFPILLIIGFMPVPAALMQGQDSLLLLLLFSAALTSIDQNNELAAGLLVGLGMFRFQLVIPIVLLFLIWRKWRFCCATCISAVLAVLLSFLVSGISGMKSYAHSLYEIGIRRQATDLKFYGVPVARMPDLRGLLFSISHLRSDLMMVVVVLVLSAAVFTLAAISGRRAPIHWQYAIAISVALLIGYHVLTHDLALLLIPMAILLNEREPHGLWNVTVLWLSTVLCFFSHEYVVAIVVLGFLFFQLWRVRYRFFVVSEADMTQDPFQVACSTMSGNMLPGTSKVD